MEAVFTLYRQQGEKRRDQQESVAAIYPRIGGGKKREVLEYTFKLQPRILYECLLVIVMGVKKQRF